MLPIATDEDFNNRILRGLLRRKPDPDIVRVQDAGLIGKVMLKCSNGPRARGVFCSRMT